MKCPKCGYNSFEFLNACKKCGSELGSFKKTHNISAIVLPISSVAAEPPLQAASQDAPQASELIFTETPPAQTASISELPDSRDAAPPAQQKNPYDGFNLDFPDSTQDLANSQEFTGFSFSDEPADEEPSSNLTAVEAAEDEFSFGDSVDEEQVSSVEDFQFDESGSELEEYERILDPESIGNSYETPEGTIPETAEEAGCSGTSDFDFSSEPETEDIFSLENEPDVPAAAEKKVQQNLEDFDKEFEMIFSFEGADDSDEKTP
jgi:hypothetical protein